MLSFSKQWQTRTDADGRFFLTASTELPSNLHFDCHLADGRWLRGQSATHVRDERVRSMLAQLAV
jgi:hypothetical protein